MERQGSSGFRESHRYYKREGSSSQTSRRRSRSPTFQRERQQRRGRRRRRSRSLDSSNDHEFRRRKNPRHRRSHSSERHQRRLRSSYDHALRFRNYDRHIRSYSEEYEYTRPAASSLECHKRRHKRRRHDHRSRRRRRSPSLSTSCPRNDVQFSIVRRTGVVSEDEPDMGVAYIQTLSKNDCSEASFRDDTVGHFRGNPGTVIADRYKILRDVGCGTFGRVVECLDLRRSMRSPRRRGYRETEFVAIKIVRSVRRYHDSAIIEAKIVKGVNGRGGRGLSHFAIMHDSFTWNSHYCLVFESLGPSLYDYLKQHNYCGFPMPCVRDFSRQLLEALDFMHSFGLIHTDLKPENILLLNYREVPFKWHGRTYMIPECTKVKVIDFGGATYDNEKKSTVVNTRQYRAPEVIIGLGWSMPSDLWSAGCILVELYLGKLLFATHDNIEHLALIETVVAPFPKHMLCRATNSQLVADAFDDNGRHRLERVLSPESSSYVKVARPLEFVISPDDSRFLGLIRMLLVVNPDDRSTAHECVNYRI